MTKKESSSQRVGHQYRLLNIQKAESKTHAVEDVINEMAADGWEVVGYSAQGWRGVIQSGFSHLLLLRRTGPSHRASVYLCPECNRELDVRPNEGEVKCKECASTFLTDDLEPADEWQNRV